MQAVPTAGGPAVDQTDDHLGHEPDQPLHLQDVQPACAGGIDGVGGLSVGVLVAGAAADTLVTTGAERPAAVFGRGAVSGQQHNTDIRRHPGVVERTVELIDGVRPKCVAHLWPVEGHPHRR